MVYIEDFSKYRFLEYGKVFLVLYLKGFSWKSELQNEFNISNKIVDKAIGILEKEGYIIAKDFWSLDIDTQECIRRLNGAYTYLIKRHPKIYTLSLEGKEEGELLLLEDLKKITKTNSSLRATVKFIEENTHNYELLRKHFQKIEDTQLTRKRVDHKTGYTYETDTRRKIEFNKNLRTAMLELKTKNYFPTGTNIITNNKNQSLTQYKSQVTYNNKILNSIEEKNIQKKISENQIKEDITTKLTKIEKEELNINANKHLLKRFNVLKEELGIDENNISKQETESLCRAIIKKIKYKGWIDIMSVQRTCKDKETFKIFLSLAKQEKIITDGSDFLYEK